MMSQTDRFNRIMRGAEAYGPGFESTPTFTLDRQIAEARASMGEARWAELQKEWKS